MIQKEGYDLMTMTEKLKPYAYKQETIFEFINRGDMMIFGRYVCNRKGKGNSNSYSQDDKVKLRSFSLPNLADLFVFTLFN